jgi:hypothetical protein
MRKLFGALLCAILTFAILGVAHPVAAQAADAGAEAQFLSSINSIRAQHGLGPLALYGELTGIARDWSDQMAGAGAISHNPNYTAEVSANWTKLGENVGVGYDVPGLMNAFVNSPAHYRNIVDPAYNYIGIGVSYGSDGRMYTTHDFMSLGDAPAPQPDPTPAPQPDPTPAPVASAPTRGTSDGSGASSAASAPTEDTPAAPAPVPPPSATPVRVAAVLTALRAVDA